MLLLFVPVNVLFGFILFYNYQSEKETDTRIMKAQELSRVTVQQQIIAKGFDEIVSELKVISNSQGLLQVINNRTSDLSGIKNDFYQLSMHKGYYDQIRYIDHTGMEIIRINYNNGQPAAVSKSKLQNKAKRYYFADAFKLTKGEVFISPLDLNIEEGEIEQPLKPMIRFGTPVFDEQGTKRGIVLFNYFAQLMIENLERVATQGFGDFSLLNSEGYWLKGQDPESEWGFMYTNRKQKTFGNMFSSEWSEISVSDDGQFTSENGLFTFATFYPLGRAQKSSTGSDEAFSPSRAQVEGKEYFFKIISHVPRAVLLAGQQRVFSDLLKLYILITLVSLVGALAGAYFLENRRRSNVERERLIKELQQALDEVKTIRGIIPICSVCKKIRDDEGDWNKLEAYIHNHSYADFSHSLCPDCLAKEMKKIEKIK